MSLRDYLNGRLSGLDQDIEQGGLDEHGFGDLPADSFSTALLHFAEQSPMETADALAPIVTRVSPVPFEPGDLPDSPEAEAVLADGGNVFELFDELAPAGADLGAVYDDADPSSFDDGTDLDGPDPDGDTDHTEHGLDDDTDDLDDDLDDADDDLDGDGLDDDLDDDLDDADDGFDNPDVTDPVGFGDHSLDHALDGEADADPDADEADDAEGYGGGGVTEIDDDLEADADPDPDHAEASALPLGDDDVDDLDELGDFHRVDDDPGTGPLEADSGEGYGSDSFDDRHYHQVDEADDGDDPAEMGFDLE